MSGLIVSDTYVLNIATIMVLSNELVADDGVVLKGNLIVIPASLHAETLAKLHESQLCTDKTHLRACSCVFWIGKSPDFEDVMR